MNANDFGLTPEEILLADDKVRQGLAWGGGGYDAIIPAHTLVLYNEMSKIDACCSYCGTVALRAPLPFSDAPHLRS